MKAWQVVAYTYKAETLCPSCTIDLLIGEQRLSPGAWALSAEEALDQLAEYDQLNREDETTFDSGEFPKVVFASQIESAEYCDSCHERII